ncbi:MAG: hypothetical protein FJ290_00010 [Planctomycetes bacterium]|nr:hypothetical protein [Planctomycetota bacterium]
MRCLWLVGALGAALAAQAASLERDAHRWVIEAEHFVGLVLYPFDNPGLGRWYAREANCRAYGAPGRGAIAAVHDTAPPAARTISKSLAPPIPPGKYKVSLRVAGTQWHDRENIVRLGIGEAPPVDFKWTWQGRFAWLPLQEVELKQPAASLSLTAAQFGGKGLRILYECQARSLWVDSIYLTSDLSETQGPSLALERCIVQGRPLANEVLSGRTPLLDVRPIEQYETPAPKAMPVAALIELRSFDGRKNLLPNSSFELGLPDGWAACNLSYTYCHIFSKRDEEAKQPFHGRYCLHVPAGSNAFSRVYELKQGGEMTLSAYVRGEAGGKVSLDLIPIDAQKNRGPKPLLSVPCTLSPDWQRFSARGNVPAGLVALQVRNGPELWLDGVQLEPGELSAYAPRAEIEGALSTDGALGNILYDEGNPQLHARFHNSGGAPQRASLRFRVVDVAERVVGEAATEPVTVPGGQTVAAPLPLGPARRGLFSATYWLDGRDRPDGELVYAILPTPPRGETRHQLGANMDTLPAAYELMSRFGFRWQLYCKIPATAAATVRKAPAEWNFPDAQLGLGQRFGLKTLPCLWPTRVPDHMADPTRKEGSTKEVTRKLNVPYPRLDLWEEFAEKMAARYRGVIGAWTVEDETEMYYTAGDFAPILEATVRGVRRADPKLRVTLSGVPDYTEELLTHIAPGQVNGFGASSYGLEHWESRKIRHLKKRFGASWYCIGVGADRQPTLYHTLPGYRPAYWSAAKTARELVYLSVVQDADAIGHYTGRLWNRTGHYNTDFPLMDYDGTPLPHGFSYACVGLLLANAEPLGDVPVGDLGIVAYLFRVGGRLGAATWATAVPKYDQHWKPARRRFANLIVPSAQRGDLEVLDMHWNPREDVRWTTGGASFHLDEAPTFLLNARLPEEKFLATLRAATADPEPLRVRLAFVPDGRGSADLGVFARNQTKGPLGNLKLDARVPYDKLLSKTEWMLKSAQGELGTLQPGRQAIGRLPLLADPGMPIENATFQVSVVEENGTEHAVDDVLWLAWAPRSPKGLKIDGDLREWAARSAAWIHITWAWGRFGRDYCQIHDGGEHFSYCTKTDIRAAAWAAYDDERLILAFRVDDDQVLLPDEKIVVKLDTDLLGDFNTPPNADDYVVTLIPRRDGKVEAKLARAGNEKSITDAAARVDEGGYSIEVAIPLNELGSVKPKPGEAIGFDFFVHDADMEESAKALGAVRWAGQCKTTGQLFFTR